MALPLAAGMLGTPGYHKVLVVDGERHIVRLVQVNLERAGLEVICAYSALETVEQLLRELPDFLMMNAMLPDADGYALTRQIKGAPRTSSLPILLFIPNGSDEEVAKARSAGADYYFAKPFNPLELLWPLRRT